MFLLIQLICIQDDRKDVNQLVILQEQMSKQKKTDTKDNNISSKLLGTNISDVNIEKFRDISNYKKTKYEINGKLSIPILKSITNKFSASVIFAIVLPNHGISSLEGLQECQNLVVLNVSRNSIENITPLRKMNKLKIIDLGENSIPNIDPLEGFKQLVNLHLEGNLIKSLDNLRSLKTCEVKNLHLQTISGNSSNPICSLKQYRQNVIQFLPSLRRLDGIPKAIEFNNGADLVSGSKPDLKIQIKNIGPFYTTGKIPQTVPFVMPTFDGENSLKKSLAGCKSTFQQLQFKLRAALAM